MSPHPARFWRLRKSGRVESVVVFHFVTSDTRQSGPGWLALSRPNDEGMAFDSFPENISKHRTISCIWGSIDYVLGKSRFECCRHSWRIPRHAGWNKSPCCIVCMSGRERKGPVIVLSSSSSSSSRFTHPPSHELCILGRFLGGEGTEESLRTVLFWHM